MTLRLERLSPVAVAAAGAGLCALTVLITLSRSSSGYEVLEAIARASMVGAPIAIGLYARRRRPFRRFGGLLVAAGIGWFFATLSESTDETLYSVGRVFGWLVEVWLVYLALAFPSGRLRGGIDRALVGAAVLILVTLYLPTALLVERYPTPSPWTDCHDACPGNAFVVTASEPAFVEDVVRPLREVLTIVIFFGVTVRLGYLIRGASHLMRWTLTPVLAVASVHVATLATAVLVRWAVPDATAVKVLVWLIALSVPAMAVAFLVGLARWRFFVAGAIQQLAARLRTHPRPEDLRDALADAFDDESLEIAYWLGNGGIGHWADAAGHPVSEPSTTSDRWLTEVRDGGRRVAAIIHDAALRYEHAFVDAATSYAVITLDNHRLSAQTASLLREVGESRARIQATADDERRRIERDLHDGAQQRLVTLRIKLELAAEQIDTGDRDGDPVLLRALGSEVDQALDEIRSLARGIYPAPLDRGLVEALRSAALQAALPTTVLATGVGRYPPEIETAAYFCCLEALQNAAKHASGATVAVIELADDGVLHIDVRDDGTGFDAQDVTEGVGLTSMRDRLAAVGGELAIDSSPGHGTRVSATIPLAPA